ncbi:MAG: hypothetical protein ACSHWQ_01295 [Spongiibacteraceae bacterium]
MTLYLDLESICSTLGFRAHDFNAARRLCQPELGVVRDKHPNGTGRGRQYYSLQAVIEWLDSAIGHGLGDMKKRALRKAARPLPESVKP